MTKEKLLAVRKQVKSRKPTFRRSQVNQFAKLRNTDNWRKPKGMGNKIRRGRKGQPGMPTVGYGSPAKVRGLGFSGLNEVIVSNTADLSKINAKEDIVVISRTIGAKKKLEVLNTIKSKKFQVANVKDIDKEIKSLTKVKKVVKKDTAKKETSKKSVAKDTDKKEEKKSKEAKK